MRNKVEYDVLIVGGGMVGASLAHAIVVTGLRVGIVEAFPADSPAQPSYDDRVIALAYGTQRILSGLHAWSKIAAEATPIRHIHISDRGHFGFTRIDREDADVEALGYVVTARLLGKALLDGLESYANLDIFCPATLESFRQADDRVECGILADGQTRQIACKLLVGADGGRSRVRTALNVKVREWTYGQTALITNISSALDHRNTAYERFTDAGPLAVLPMTQGRCSVVWTLADEEVDRHLELDDAEFLRRLQTRFGYRLGKLHKVGKRYAYPLKLAMAKEHVRSRVALIGNAAHTLHPVAGQGFNLGIRDVAALAELLAAAAQSGSDPGSDSLLQSYARWRRFDQQLVGLATDGLARFFTNPLTPIHVARDAGLLALDLFPAARRVFARRFMGLSGNLPKLARGLPLG